MPGEVAGDPREGCLGIQVLFSLQERVFRCGEGKKEAGRERVHERMEGQVHPPPWGGPALKDGEWVEESLEKWTLGV